MPDPEYPEDPPLDPADALINEGFQAYLAQLDEHGEADVEALLAEPKYAAVADALRADIEEDRRRPPPMMADTPTIPNPFGKYRLLKELGRGGMGVVYHAWERKSRLDVALKVLLPGQDRDRFEREVQDANRLDHENIIRILDPGIQDGPAYFSMELADGTLAGVAAGLRDDPRRLAEVMLKVARAVHHAHQRGILHRDLKPGNVLMKGGVPKVADFGLAKRIGHPDPAQAVPRAGARPGDTLDASLNGDTQSLPPSSALGTRAGAILGTPEYMAPEQARADPSPTVSVDVHGLGAILYELLTGRPPFPRGEGEGVYDVLERVIHQDPEPPRRSAPRTDPDLETICLECMKKEPAERYSSAAEVADELERFLAHRPIRRRPRPWWERLRMWARRDPLRAALTLIISLLAGGVLALAVWMVRARIDGANELARMEHESRQRLLYALKISEAGRHMDERRKAPTEEEVDAARALADAALADTPLGLRCWVYRHLHRDNHVPVVRLQGHTGSVGSITYSPDGLTILTGANDGTARLWDVASGGAVRALLPPAGRLPGEVKACFTADGRHVITASGDRKVRLWDVAGGEPKFLRWDGSRVACSTGAGGLIASAAPRDVGVRLYRQDGAYLGVVRTPSNAEALAISPDGRFLALSRYSAPPLLLEIGPVRGGEVAARVVPLPPAEGRHTIYAIRFSPDGRRLAVGHVQPTLYELPSWPWAGCRLVRAFGGSGTQAPAALAFRPDGEMVAAPYQDGGVRVWDVSTGLDVGRVRPHKPGVFAASFSPDGKSLAVMRGHVVTVETRGAATRPAWCGLPALLNGPVTALAFEENGVLAARVGEHVTRWAPRGVGPPWVRRLGGEGGSLLSAGGHLLADLGGRIVSVTGKVWPQEEVGKGMRSLAAAATSIAGLSGEREVRVIDITVPAKPVAWLPLEGRGDMRAVALSRDGGVLAAGGDGGVLFLLRLETSRQKAGGPPEYLEGHRATVHAVAFNEDGTLLASAGDDEKVILWDVRGRSKRFEMKGHLGMVKGIAFSPTEPRLATCSTDGSVKVWDTDTGMVLLTLMGAGGPLTRIAFSADGHLLAAGDEKGRIRVWDGSPSPPLE